MSIELVILSNHVILCYLLLQPLVFPSIKVFSSQSALCIRWPKYWSLSFSISISNEYPGLISFRIGWFDLLTVQQTLLKSLLQHRNLKATIILCLAFFRVQILYSYITTEKSNINLFIESQLHIRYNVFWC